MKDILASFGVKEVADCDVPGTGDDKADGDKADGDKADGDKKSDDKDSGANGIFGGTMAALAVGAAALL